jgi:polysaccharide biosynthesis/export protein
VSAKRPLEMFRQIGITGRTGSGMEKHPNQPIAQTSSAGLANGTAQSAIASLTLLALLTTAVPAPSNAQLPTLPVPRDSQSPPNLTPGGVPIPAAPVTKDSPIPSFSTPPSSPQVPPPPPGTTPSGFSNLPPETPYILGAGDRIRVDVFDVPEYSGEFAVLVDGTVNLPVVGSVLVRGNTLQQASATISTLYARYVRRPLVTISLLAPRPVNIAVAGEVNRPGTYTVTPAQGGGTGPQTGQFPTVELLKRQLLVRYKSSAAPRQDDTPSTSGH